jgi:hypothetical protein
VGSPTDKYDARTSQEDSELSETGLRMTIDEVAERLGISSKAAHAVVKAALVSTRYEKADKLRPSPFTTRGL